MIRALLAPLLAAKQTICLVGGPLGFAFAFGIIFASAMGWVDAARCGL